MFSPTPIITLLAVAFGFGTCPLRARTTPLSRLTRSHPRHMCALIARRRRFRGPCPSVVDGAGPERLGQLINVIIDASRYDAGDGARYPRPAAVPCSSFLPSVC